MKTLIFEPTISGHHLEYLHHYYVGALEHPQEDFVFVVTRKFEEVKDKHEWETSNNISIQYIDSKYDSSFNASNPYVLGWKTSIVLRDYVKLINPDKVILTMLMQFIPFICWLLPGGVKVRGIMYKIYLYEQSKMSKLRLLAERFRFWLASRSREIESIFVLNDKDSASEFNRIYRTDKFKYIPDPVPEVNLAECKDIREDLGIPATNKMFLHFGGLAKRKGTLEILKAIDLCSEVELRGKTFVFAGKFKDSLRTEFYPLLDRVKHKAQIIVFDEFCSYEFLYDLCYSCDVILMPYQITNLSSGVIGYAAVFGKPVVGPSDGLIGRLILDYNMGIAIDTVSALYIEQSFSTDVSLLDDRYVSVNNLRNFISILLK